MKKIISIYGIMGSLLIAMLPGVSSCDKLEDELFKKNTSLIPQHYYKIFFLST